MASLTGSTIAESYEQLLCLPDGGGNTSNLVAVTDGDGGTTFCISLTDASTGKAVLAVDGSHANGTEIQIDNSATDGDAFLSFQLSGTSKFTMGVDDGDSDKFKIGTTAIGTGTMFALDTNSKISLSNNDSGGTSGQDSTSGNTFFGYLAGQHSENGSHNNTLIGHKAAGGASWANFENNVVIGTNAGAAATEADQCVIIGQNAGTAITGSEDLVLVGQGAGSSLTDNVDKVVFIGRNAGATTNSNNAVGTVGIGHSALTALTSGVGNVAIGYQAMQKITTGGYNTVVGHSAFSDTDGANGVQGRYNVHVGYNSGGGNHGNGLHQFNTVVGADSMTGVCDSAAYNSVFGYNCGAAITSGDYNTIMGASAGDGITGGSNNICVGYLAGHMITTGSSNIVIGLQAVSGGSGVTGAGSVVIGSTAGYNMATTAANNTFMGDTAGHAVTTGQNNLFLGHDAGITGSPGGNITTQSSTVVLGDEYISNFYCADDSISTSDSRDKADVTDFTDGLAWVNSMRPITYKWDKRSWYIDKYDPDVDLNEVVPDGTHKKTSINIGLIAQEVLEIEEANGFGSDNDTSLLVDLTEDGKQYGLKYARVVPILVKAIQELSAEVEKLKENA